jgi:hypothetical protein
MSDLLLRQVLRDPGAELWVQVNPGDDDAGYVQVDAETVTHLLASGWNPWTRPELDAVLGDHAVLEPPAGACPTTRPEGAARLARALRITRSVFAGATRPRSSLVPWTFALYTDPAAVIAHGVLFTDGQVTVKYLASHDTATWECLADAVAAMKAGSRRVWLTWLYRGHVLPPQAGAAR